MMCAKTADQLERTYIPLCVPHLRGNEWKYVKECLDTGWVSTAGNYVSKFESEVAACVGSSHAVAVINGTAALHLSLLLSGVEPRDEVVVPTITFIAPINSVRYVSATPVFMDCGNDLNIDAEKTIQFCEKECTFNGSYLINKSTKAKIKALIVVHVLGNPTQIEPLLALASKYNLKLIEDAAEAMGSFYKEGSLAGKKAGAVGGIGCLSFNGNKIITSGGGGMILTNDAKIAERARYYTTQAKDDADLFLHHRVGFNHRLTNVDAAIGCAQLEQLDRCLRTKKDNHAHYKEGLQNIPGVRLLEGPPYAQSNHWLHTIMVDRKKFGLSALELSQHLKKLGIEARLLWYPNHLQKPYRQYQAYKIEKAMTCHAGCLNLPSSVGLAQREIEIVCNSIRRLGKDKTGE